MITLPPGISYFTTCLVSHSLPLPSTDNGFSPCRQGNNPRNAIKELLIPTQLGPTQQEMIMLLICKIKFTVESYENHNQAHTKILQSKRKY
jgi:hypothetical protein